MVLGKQDIPRILYQLGVPIGTISLKNRYCVISIAVLDMS